MSPARYARRDTLLLLGAASLMLGAAPSCATRPPIALQGTEVREYQGQKLSSVSDTRENSIKGPQTVSTADYRLAVFGEVDRSLTLTYEDVLNRSHVSKAVTLHCVEGWDSTILWEGVLLDDLLKQAGVQSGANTVIFHAADGYTSSLPLQYVRDNQIILAHKMNDVVLPAERGFPFHVVAESKWGYKWVRWVTRIEASDDPRYRGFWESSGYNNNGDLSGSKFER
jgi:DMSO/TMAO reductase YedYZ molybdopterin-dependent catalytic subunit